MCWTLHWRMNWSAKVRMNREAQWEGLGKTDEDFNFLNYLLEEGRVGDDWVCICPCPEAGTQTLKYLSNEWLSSDSGDTCGELLQRREWQVFRVWTKEEGALQCLPGSRLGIQMETWWEHGKSRLITGSDFPWRTCLEESDTFSDSARPGRRSQAGVRNVWWASHWDQVRWGYQKREWEACDREWGQGIYIITILLRGKQSHFPASVRILGERVVFLLPFILGCCHHTLQPPQVRALLIWAQGRREYSRVNREGFLPHRGCLSSTWAHQNSQLSSTVLHVADPPGECVRRGVTAPGHLPFRRKPRRSQSRAHPGEGPTPHHLLLWLPAAPTVSSWPGFNWSHPSLMSPKEHPEPCPASRTKGHFWTE